MPDQLPIYLLLATALAVVGFVADHRLQAGPRHRSAAASMTVSVLLVAVLSCLSVALFAILS